MMSDEAAAIDRLTEAVKELTELVRQDLEMHRRPIALVNFSPTTKVDMQPPVIVCDKKRNGKEIR